MTSLGKNIAYYRKEKELSQEKLAELLGISRQAVTKWENDVTKPSSTNLLKLAEILDIQVEQLLDSQKRIPAKPISIDKGPLVYFFISVIFVFFYIFSSARNSCFNIGTLICLLVVAVPIQLFLHLYFVNAIKNNNYTGIAGYDSSITYNEEAFQKLLQKIDHHIGISSTTYIIFTSLLGSGFFGIFAWTEYLLFLYVAEFTFVILYLNYLFADQIYVEEADKKRSRAGFPGTIGFLLTLIANIACLIVSFHINNISNNSLPALKLAGILLVGVAFAIAGMLYEGSRIKKWNPTANKYRLSTPCISCYIIALFCSIFMLI